MRLTVHDPSGARASIPFGGASLNVGRQDGNDVLLPAASVSRRHCRFVRTARGVDVEDLQSTGGVHVDGRPIEGRVALRPGQVIAVGPYKLVLEGEPGDFGFAAGGPNVAVQDYWRLPPGQAHNDPPATRRVVGA